MPRIAIIDPNKCKPDKCAKECIKKCPPQKMGKQVIDIEDIASLNIQTQTNKSDMVRTTNDNNSSKLTDKKKLLK